MTVLRWDARFSRDDEGFTIDLLRRLIQEDSTVSEDAVVEVLEDAAASSGLRTRRLSACKGHTNLLIGFGESDLMIPDDPERLILNSHMDTSPVGGVDTWTMKPFGGEVKNGAIFGRGASDAKGGLAAMLSAMRVIKRDIGHDRGVLMTAVAQETAGNVGTRALVAAGLKGGGAIVGEHSMARSVAVAYRGVAWIEVEARGRSAHPGRSGQGVDAIALVIEQLIPRLKSAISFAEHHPLLPDSQLTVTQISGGHNKAMIADRARITLDARTLPDQSVEAVLASLESVCAAVEGDNPGCSISISPKYWIDGFETNQESDVFKMVERALESALGERPTTIGKVGMCDGNVLANEAGIDTVIFGPGNPSGMGPDEHCRLDALFRASNVVASVIAEWIATRHERA